MSKPFLSKTKYLAGLQCQKLLWFNYNAKAEIPAVDAQTQAIFDQGHAVGELAKKLFPDGIDVKWDQQFREVLAQSKELLKERKPLFEAGFFFDQTYARVDILNPVRGGEWDIVEVKSSSEVKDVNYHDLALQRYCYEGAGVTIRKCFLMHIDTEYVRRGEVDPAGLFTKVDVTAEVLEAGVDIKTRIENMLSTIALKKCPAIDIGTHCSDPYACPLTELCWKHVDKHENNIFTLFRLRAEKQWDLYSKGIIRNDQIPADYNLTASQKIQLDAERTGKPHVDKAVISSFLSDLKYPLYFLDFETFMTAIPLVDGTHPYQNIPFQFSLHIAANLKDEPEHHSWLWDGAGDPQAEMLARLRKLLGAKGSIIAFNASFEKTVQKSCVDGYPENREWLDGIEKRFLDLLSPFRNFDVYYPSQHGTASIKKVLPALTGKGYDTMAIQGGGQASDEFKRVMFCDVPASEREQVRRNLEEYCGLDTMGMLDIVRALERLR